MTISCYRPPRTAGFTLIELLVTLALAAILAGLAAPSVREFIVRSRLGSLGSEFSGSVMRVRNEAVNRNSCVTLCQSSNAQNATPSCASGESKPDWQRGWIAFVNDACNYNAITPTTPADLLLARPQAGADYRLISDGGLTIITFNALGATRSSSSGAKQFNLIYRDAQHPLTKAHGFNICMDSLGHTRTIPENKTCDNYQ